MLRTDGSQKTAMNAKLMLANLDTAAAQLANMAEEQHRSPPASSDSNECGELLALASQSLRLTITTVRDLIERCTPDPVSSVEVITSRASAALPRLAPT
jgi:hypothetical protein